MHTLVCTKKNKKNKTYLCVELSHKKTMTYAGRNPGPGLGQAQQCCRGKPINGIPALTLTIQLYC